MEDKTNEIQEYSNEPDIDYLKSDLERCRTNLSYWRDRAEEARDIRMSNWPGKGKYGRKPDDPKTFPWPNASDLSGNVINGLVDGDVALLKSALNKGNLIASPTESGDIESAKMVTDFMRWRMNTIEELPREAGVAANYLLEQGICFIGTYFRREVRRLYRPITLEEIAEMSPDFASALGDPDMTDSVKEVAQSAFPNLSKKRVNKMISELRKDGVTEIPTDKITMNRPGIRAYELGRDLIVDSNILDLQSARAIYCVHYLTPEMLREKVIVENWDSDWVDEVISSTTGENDNAFQGSFDGLFVGAGNEAPEQYDGLVKVITCYRKEIDDSGVSVCSMTVFSEKAEGYATHYTMSVDSGRYPFVAITRETISRRLLDSRGYCEILRDIELAVKTEIDSRRDRASLSTCPPIEYQIGRKPEAIGAGAKIPVRRRGEVGFMEIPPMSPASMEVERELRQIANRLCGRPTSADDVVEATTIRQSLVNNWLQGWSQVLKRLWALERAYNGGEVWYRVTNNPAGANLILDETAEEYDISLQFSTESNDTDKVIEKLQAIGTVMSQYDRQGQGRYDVLVSKFIQAIDPNLAQELITPAPEAQTKIIEETSQDIAKIASGQVVNAPQEGVNPQLRLQVLDQWLQGTEEIPALDIQDRLAEDESFRARVDTYRNQLIFRVQQMENALVGQLGTAPGNVPASSA